MNKSEILEHISHLPAVEQVELVETVLHGLGDQLRQSSSANAGKRQALRLQMAEAAAEAEAYYRTDADVALWRGLEGEPIHEYVEGDNLASGPGPDHRRGNDQNATGTDR